jgi:hypothetical protein
MAIIYEISVSSSAQISLFDNDQKQVYLYFIDVIKMLDKRIILSRNISSHKHNNTLL